MQIKTTEQFLEIARRRKQKGAPQRKKSILSPWPRKKITASCGCKFSQAGWEICQMHWAMPVVQSVYQRMRAEGRVRPPRKRKRNANKTR